MSGRLLAIRLRALGDVVLTTPALRALRKGFPDASLEVVTEARYAPLLEGLPGVEHVWRLERSTGATLRLAAHLRRRRYALAVDFFGNPRSAFLTAASGARATVGWDLRGRRYAYRHRVPRAAVGPEAVSEYSAAAHVRLAVAAGGRPDGLDPRLPLGGAARQEGASLLARAGVESPGQTLGLLAAGTWGTKTWPASHAGLLARDLLAAGRPVLLIAGPGEERVSAAVARIAPGARVLPPCDVGALVAVIARLGAVVGLDSGPRHVATAFGIPTYAWFGPTHPDHWTLDDPRHGVWWTALPCRGCNRTVCPHWNCLPGLEPHVAARLVTDHLERHGGTAADLDPAARA